MKNETTIARLLGILSGVILAYTSVALLAPVKWNLRYLGGTRGLLLGLALSVLLSVVAAKSAERWWYLLIVWAAAIVVYLGWFYHPPMWS